MSDDRAVAGAVPPVGPRPLVAGLVLGGRYRLVRPLASGGMASVWEGHDEVLTRPVALKLPHAHLATDPSFRERFRREAVSAARLSHPCIVSTYDTGTDADLTYIVMELVVGRTLKDALTALGPFPVELALGVAVQVADALDAAHRAGLIHRDVKPANILLVEDGRAAVPRVKVADFGVARMVQAVAGAAGPGDLTREGQVIGTAKYLAPEQVDARPLDARTDVYALGIVLHEVLAGTPPFVRPTDVSTALAQLQDPPPHLSTLVAGVPPSLEALVLSCLAKSPDDRPPSAADLAAALRSIAGDLAAGPRTVTMAPVPQVRGAEPTTALPLPATPPPGTPGPALRPAPRKVAGRSRTPAIVVASVVGAALVTTAIVLSASGGGPTIKAGTTPTTSPSTTAGASGPLAAGYSTFDPQPRGDGKENDAKLANLDDDDTSTVWSTDTYNVGTLSPFKDGVGVVLDLGEERTVRSLTAYSQTVGWSARVYLADNRGQTRIADWGSPVASQSDIKNPRTTFVLPGAPTTRYLLLWITVTGVTGGANRTEIGDLRAAG